MSGSAIELVDLIARWIHVIAAIMWAGNSMLFNWLDRNLRPGSRDAAGGNAPGALGQIWLLHSGAFYYVEKTLLGGQPIPKPMHWFKWQAYTTWWSGMVLLIAVYWFGGRALLESGTGNQVTHTQAVWIAAGSILVGWALYESMQRFVAPRHPRIAIAAWIAGLTALSIVLLHFLNGRAAFLHAGAMLGTIMAANVFFTIVPSQRELVASVNEGRGADPAVSARAKRVSIHNNYFTFPVIVLMVSVHFPAIYGGRLSWLLLLTLIAAGAAVRHVLNIRFTLPSWQPILAATIAAGTIALFTIMRAGTAPLPRRDFDCGAGDIRRGTSRHRQTVRGLSRVRAERPELWRGPGWRDVRYAGADSRARGENSRARSPHSNDAAREQDEHDGLRAGDTQSMDRRWCEARALALSCPCRSSTRMG